MKYRRSIPITKEVHLKKEIVLKGLANNPLVSCVNIERGQGSDGTFYITYQMERDYESWLFYSNASYVRGRLINQWVFWKSQNKYGNPTYSEIRCDLAKRWMKGALSFSRIF